MRFFTALISKSPHIENILAGRKTWEIRGRNTKIRGEIALIKSGSGTIVGKCEIIDVIGPLDFNELEDNINKHCVPLKSFDEVFGRYKKIYAWKIKNIFRLEKPIKYEHPKGAIIWVNLHDSCV